MSFLVDNWVAILAVALAAGALIVKATPSTSDDVIFAKVKDALSKLGVK